MSGTVFNIGVTNCGKTMAALVEYQPDNVIGTFWLPSGAMRFCEVSAIANFDTWLKSKLKHYMPKHSHENLSIGDISKSNDR